MHVPTDLPQLSKFDIIVDNTILESAICSTRVALRHVLGLTTKVEGVELVCGSAIHEGLARWAIGKGPEVALARFDKVYKPWAEEHVPKLDDKGKPTRLRWAPVHRIFERWLKTH